MTIELSVSEVRDALERSAHSDDVGAGSSSTRLLGRLFHEVHRDLVGSDPLRNGLRLLPELERNREAWHAALLQHTYRSAVGPRLALHQPHLQTTTDAVLGFWTAVHSLVAYLVDVVWTFTARSPQLKTDELEERLLAEIPLQCELSEPSWSERVRLTGIADGMIRVPGTGSFCAVELKLGKSNPAIDLGQVALYHLITARLAEHSSASTRTDGAVALLRFTPECEQLVIEHKKLAGAQHKLLQLIGELAGVAAKAGPEARPGGDADVERSREHAQLARKITRAFSEYGRRVEVAEQPVVGPRYLRFAAKLGPGVKFEQIRGLSAELGLRLGVEREPIVTKSLGKLCIDVERPDPEIVAFETVRPSLGQPNPRTGSSRLVVGVRLDGGVELADLAEPNTAHVLVAGMTGSGKTEWLRTAIASLLVCNTPETLRLVLIDPKQTAFQELKRSPFLWDAHAFWLPGSELAITELLARLVAEMERRYQLLARENVDDLAHLVAKTGRPLARIVVFCDEYYALVSQSTNEDRKEIERAIGLLGSKARAAGVHLVLAMQQASRQVLKGPIDANIPCRVALLTSSAIESRMVLQAPGADQLTGRGDLLYRVIGEPIRLQAPLLRADERRELWGSA